MITIEGYVKKTIFNNGGDFKVYSFVPLQKYKDMLKTHPVFNTISINGFLPNMLEDILYKLDVEYVKKGQYDNYEVKRIYTPKKDMDESATINFLKTITSEARALELFRVYPNIINMMLDGEEIDTSKLKNIGNKTISDIKKKVIENFQLFDLIDEYKDYEMTLTMIQRLYDTYPSVDKIKEKMEEDPYHCLCKINKVGFKTADNIIMNKMPHKIDSRMRAEACIRFLLNQNEQEGNTWIDVQELLTKFDELAKESRKHFPSIIKESEDIFFETNMKVVSYTKTRMCEVEIANMLFEMSNNNIIWDDINVEDYRNVNGINLTDEQMKVMSNICKHNVNILAGVGGSGKSFSMQGVMNMLDDNIKNYLVLASTGKASKVLSSYIDKEVKTIHRGLEYNPAYGFKYGIGEYTHNGVKHQRIKLPYDIIIVEEFSMVDIFLLRDLLRAIDITQTKILFIGDPAQIPSVSVGNISFDMIQSCAIPTALLTTVFRYGEGGLSYVATEIREGRKYLDTSQVIETFGINKDYRFINVEQEESIKFVTHLYGKYIKDGSSTDDIMVLTAYNKGAYGTVMLNKAIQELVNPIGDEVVVKRNGVDIIFRVEDKVMQIKNNYQATKVNDDTTPVSIFNGDIGVIKSITKDGVVVEIADELILYDKSSIATQLDLAYAMSIHKSQGSSANRVILITPKAHKYFLDRNLLYVAASRAKNTMDHIGTHDVITSALRKSANKSRNTYLKTLIENKFK